MENNEQSDDNFFVDIRKEYQKLEKEISKKHTETHKILSASLTSLDTLRLIYNTDNYQFSLPTQGKSLIAPIQKIVNSKFQKVYFNALFLLKKLIEYNLIDKEINEDVSKIFKDFFDLKSQEDTSTIQIKILEICLLLINSPNFDTDNINNIKNIFYIIIKTLNSKSFNTVFKHPLTLIFFGITNNVICSGSEDTKINTMNLIITTITDAKKKETNNVKFCMLELICKCLKQYDIKQFQKENNFKEFLNNTLITSVDAFFNNPKIIEESCLALKLLRLTKILMTKFLLGFELMKHVLKFALNFQNITQMKFGLEVINDLFKDIKILNILYSNYKDNFTQILDLFSNISQCPLLKKVEDETEEIEITKEDILEMDKNVKDEVMGDKNRKFSVNSKYRFTEKEELFLDNTEESDALTGLINYSSSPKAIHALIISVITNLKNTYIAIMKENDIEVNQLNFNLSSKQNEVKAFLQCESDKLNNGLISLLNISYDDSNTQSYLNIIQDLIGIYASIYIPKLRDSYIKSLCDLILYPNNNNNSNSTTNVSSSNNIQLDPDESKSFLKNFTQKKFLVCQSLINLSHCVNFLDVNSWLYIIETLQKVYFHLNVKFNKEENYDSEFLLKNINLSIMEISESNKSEEVLNEISMSKKKEDEDFLSLIDPEMLNKTIQKETVQILIISINSLFIDSNSFDTESLCNIISALSMLILNDKNGEKNKTESEVYFYLLKTFQVAVVNIQRIEVIYSISTEILTSVIIEKKYDEKISKFALDILGSIISIVISKYSPKRPEDSNFKEEWSKEKFQRSSLEPLIHICRQENFSKEINSKILSSLTQIIHHSGNQMDTFGWACTIELITLMINENCEACFYVVKNILTDFYTFLTPFNLNALLSLLGIFSIYESNNNICFSAIELFWSCANLIVTFQKEYQNGNAQVIQSLNENFGDNISIEELFNELWTLLFIKLVHINCDNRKEVKICGLNVFAEIFMAKIQFLSAKEVKHIIYNIFFKILTSNIQGYRDSIEKEKKENYANYCKNNEEFILVCLLSSVKIIKSYLGDKITEESLEIFLVFEKVCQSLIQYSSPYLIVKIFKCLNDIKILNKPEHIFNPKYHSVFWDFFNELKKYFLSPFYMDNYSTEIEIGKLLSSLLDFLGLFLLDETIINNEKENFLATNMKKFSEMVSIILSSAGNNNKKEVEANPHKPLRAENNLFLFLNKIQSISTLNSNLKALYDINNEYFKYDFTNPHSEVFCLLSFKNLIEILCNKHFDILSYIKPFINSVKTLFMMRSQSASINMLLKNHYKNPNELLIFIINESFIEFLTGKKNDIKEEEIWEEILTCFELLIKQTEEGYYSNMNKEYIDVLIGISQEMEMKIINFLTIEVLPMSLNFSKKIQDTLFSLIDRGIKLDYGSLGKNSAVNKDNISNLFELCKYKTDDELIASINSGNDNEEKKKEFIELKKTIAKVCTPILIKKLKTLMKRYLYDEMKSGAMPLSRGRLDEIKYILESLKSFEVFPNFMDVLYRKKANEIMEDEEENKEDEYSKINPLIKNSRKAHLFYLFSTLNEFILVKELSVKYLVKDLFNIVNKEIGCPEI